MMTGTLASEGGGSSGGIKGTRNPSNTIEARSQQERTPRTRRQGDDRGGARAIIARDVHENP
jgi:hypothetical protein